MILGSHNTMSYLKPQWWFRPFTWTSKCQCLSYLQQYANGVKVFDLRIKFDKKGNPFFAHGVAHYKSVNVYNVLKDLNSLKDTIWVKVSYESRNNKNHSIFKAFCSKLKNEYRNIMFFGGMHSHPNKEGLYEQVYNFKTAWPEPLIGKHASWNKDLLNRAPTGYRFDDIFPILYSVRNNSKNIEKYKDRNVYLMIDFVGKYYQL